MSEVGVFLSGEGRNELGSRAGDPSYQTDDEPGVVEALLQRVQEGGWKAVGALQWSRIRKYSARGPMSAEERNVLGIVLEARRAEARAVAFVRDADGDRERTKIIERASERAREEFPDIEVIGGTPFPVLEGWLLALMGEMKTEELGKAAAHKGVEEKNTAAMVGIVETADLTRIPKDARTLRSWIQAARETLPTLVAAQSNGSASTRT